MGSHEPSGRDGATVRPTSSLERFSATTLVDTPTSSESTGGHSEQPSTTARGEIFSMAGLWETWSSNGKEIRSATIITTDANDVVGELHDRTPVILDEHEEERWLEEDDEDELLSMLDPFPGERTETFEVFTAVNNPENEGPQLIEPKEGDQTGLGEFS